MPSSTNRSVLRQKIKRVLLSAGASGISQTKLIAKCRTHIWKREHIEEILGDWLIREYVQQFLIKTETSKKPVKIWRATKLIVNAVY